MRIAIYKIPTQEKVLNNLGFLLEKISAQHYVGVLCDSNIESIVDNIFWTFSTNVFLPHNIATGLAEEDKKQPVLISGKLELLNREVLCLLTNKDLVDVLGKKKDFLNKVECVVYITQEDFDIRDFVDKILTPDVDSVDIFEKVNKKWKKLQNILLQ